MKTGLEMVFGRRSQEFTLMAALLGSSMMAIAQNVDCGQNPEQNIKWSSNFKKATLHYACSSVNDKAEYLGEAGDFSNNYDQASCNLDSLNDESANQFVQTEIANQRAAVVATCGFYACKMSGTSMSVPNIAALSAVCSQAIENHGAGANNTVGSDFRVVPAYLPVVAKATAQSVRIFVENLSNGDLKFDRPISPEGGATVVSPSSSTFSVAPHSGKWLSVRLNKPSGEDVPKLVSMPINVHSSVEDQSTMIFAVGNSAQDFLPPLGLGCGRLNPHMTVTAYSDRAMGQGFDPKSFSSTVFTDVPVGEKNSFQSQFSEYHNNGGGEITILMNSTCTQLDATRKHSTVILSFDTTTNALSGHCCGGFGPGGDGTTNPEWVNNFTLPGKPGRDKWSLTLVTKTTLTGPSPSCTLKVDGTELSLDVNVQRTRQLSFDPGKHEIRVACQEGRIGSRPGNWNDRKIFNETLGVTLDAHLD